MNVYLLWVCLSQACISQSVHLPGCASHRRVSLWMYNSQDVQLHRYYEGVRSWRTTSTTTSSQFLDHRLLHDGTVDLKTGLPSNARRKSLTTKAKLSRLALDQKQLILAPQQARITSCQLQSHAYHFSPLLMIPAFTVGCTASASVADAISAQD
jgi:hypothetical protein